MMRSKEWPLIIFTLAMQLSVGVFVLLWGFNGQLVPAGGQRWAEVFTGLLLGMILLVMIVGVLAATLHLGNPRNAYLALANWRSSWLSREMLLGLIFGGLVCLYALLPWLGLNQSPIRLILGGLASLAGLLFVFGISKLYLLRTVPAWNTPATPVTFYASTFLLGGLLLGAALSISAVSQQLEPIFRLLGLLVIAAMGLQLATFALHTATLSGQGSAAAQSAGTLGMTYRQIAIWRLVLLTCGGILFALYAFQIFPVTFFAVFAFTLVLLSEVLGRFLFYESYIRVGL